MKKLKNNLTKLFSKTCLTFVGLTSVINLTLAQSQNNVLSLAPNYLKNSTPFNLPQGPNNGLNYAGEQAESCHNAMQDANGNLLFFMVDDKLYDKDGYFIDYVAWNNIQVKGTSEIVFVPDPVNCQKYYIIAAGRAVYDASFTSKTPFIAILDLSVPNIFSPGRFGALELSSSGTAAKLPYYNQISIKDGSVYIAASKLRNDNSRFVFVSSEVGIYRYKIDNSGFNYDNYFVPYNTTGSESIGFRGEMELIEMTNGNYRISSIFPGITLGTQVLFSAELDNTGTLISSSANIFGVSSGSPMSIRGLEYSPSGNILYVTHNITTQHPNPIEFYDFNNPSLGFQALNVTNANDFQFTQIELGKNGLLYFATNNRLATLSNPNSPSVSNWTNNAQSISYYTNSEAISPAITEFVSYMLPDQIDGMDYQAHFFANLECCLINSYYDASIFTATSSATWSPGVGNNPFSSTSGIIYIENELRIPVGKTITIQNMTFKFAPGAKVIIERGVSGQNGGKLILNQTTFTVNSVCDPNLMWLGVQVHGYNNQVQGTYSNSQQGWLIMNNGAVIEHAMRGAVAVKINNSLTYPYNFTGYDFSYAGGVIRATNSSFKNNRQDVEFRKYISSGNNLSYFTNCDFTTNGLLNNPTLYPTYHVMMNEVVGIAFNGNTFQNLTPQLYTYWKQGVGIYSTDAQTFVNARCTSSSYPCTSFDPNIFQDLYFGIRALSVNSTRTIKVDKNKFINNYFGIYLGSVDFATITKNDFEVYRSSAPNLTFQTYGLYMNACTGYIVQENSFTEYNDPLVSSSGNTYGIIVNNSGISDNEIYKNNFNNIKIGGQSQNINSVSYNPSAAYPNNIGLRWKCNIFNNDIYQADLSITSGRIAYQQGYAINPVIDPVNSLKSPAGNRFSHSTFDLQNDIAANNSVLPFTYTHHADLITTPIYYNPLVVSPQLSFNATYPVYYDNTKSCPSKIKSSIILSAPALKFQSDSLKQVIALKENMIDGGNTNYLLNVIATQNSGDVKNALMAASPYLSEEVLIAYLSTNPPSGNVRQVIIANSPVSADVKNVLNGLNLPKGIKTQINTAQSGMSAMKYLYNEISYATTERNSIVDERIRLFLNDTIISNPLDSVALILKEENRELRKKQLCDTYISKGDTLLSAQTRDSIAFQYGYDNYVKLADIQMELRNTTSSCYIINTDQLIRQEVELVTYDQVDRINAIKGEAYLGLAFDSLFLAVVEPLYEIGSGLRMAQDGDSESEILEKESSLSIYPNPSNGTQVSIEYKGLESIENTTIEVYNLSGILVANYQLSSNSNIVSIPSNKLNSGVYFVKLFSNKQLVETKKLIINL
ncbi:MAG: T9SS type A sorting domain-containing protein [Crocinitomicaceae bacterium]|nr:T9SS type A sorting domain-containing protein [Crocinitomicaceae bacterium]